MGVLTWQLLQEEEPEKYQSHFAKYLAEDLEADGLEEMYTAVHEAIRADPSIQLTEKTKPEEPKRYAWGRG